MSFATCRFCGDRFEPLELVDHLFDEHEDEIAIHGATVTAAMGLGLLNALRRAHDALEVADGHTEATLADRVKWAPR